MHKVMLFACIEKNIGDDIFVKIVCDRYKNTEFVITSDAKYGSLKLLENLTFSKTLKLWNKFSNNESNNSFKYSINRILCIIFGIFLRKRLGVYIVGNAFKNLEYKGRIQSQWIRDRISLCNEFFLISTNFGSYSDERWKQDFEGTFPNITDVCFRDMSSYNLFKKFNNIRYAPDAVFTLGFQERKKQIENNVLISVIDFLLDGRPLESKRYAKDYENAILGIVGGVLSKGYKVTLLNSNTLQDRPVAKRIRYVFDKNVDIEIYDYLGDLEEVFDLFSRSKYVIGTRLHTIILSFLFELPVIPIVYDIKVEGILNSCNFDGIFYRLSDLRNITFNQV